MRVTMVSKCCVHLAPSDVIDTRVLMETIMKQRIRILASSILLATSVSLTACSNMTARDQNTAIGAGVGAVAGAVLTGGSTAGTVGGAAVGGVIGNKVSKPPR